MTRARTQHIAWLGLALIAVGFYVIGLTLGDDTPQTLEERAYAIKETTLCPICDGQNVLESNAAIATSIRALVDELVASGLTDDQVRSALANEFGDDVNAIPPSTGWGALVWIVPVVVVIIAIGAIVLSVSRWRETTARRAAEEDRRLVDAARRQR